MDSVDDKEHSALGVQPWLSFTTKGGRSYSSVNLGKVIPLCAVLGVVLMYANLTVACMTNFMCGKFVPTPDYLGCFRGFDRLHIVTATYAAVVFGVVLVGLMSRVRVVIGVTRRAVLLISGCCVFMSLPLSALTDEVNAVHSLPMEQLHSLFNRILCVAGPVWVLTSYSCISQLHSMLNTTEKRWFRVLQVLVMSLCFLCVGTVVEIQLAYSAYSGKYINEVVESGMEWTLAGSSFLLLAVFSQFIRGFALRFSVQCSGGDADSDKAELEMTKI